MIYPLRKLAQTRESFAMARNLRLGCADALKYVASIGVDNWPKRQSVISVEGFRLPIRWNRIDAYVVHEVMSSVYHVRSAPSRILDLGSNIGAAAVYFAKRWPLATIACVEPQAENLPVLKRTIVLNNLRAVVFPVAVAVQDGTEDLFVDHGDPSSSTLIGNSQWERRSVSALSVPTLMEKMGWNWIDLLKTDIEGYEAQLFSRRSEWLRNVGEIAGEVHYGYRTRALREDLGRYGFCVEVLSRNQENGMRVFHASKEPF